MKIAIVVLSDPKTGSEEALGRVFNALAAAHDFKTKGDDLALLFLGAGTRWIGELNNPEHPVHGLYKAVEDKVVGASNTCSEFFGAMEGVQQAGVQLLKDNPAPGTAGLPSLQAFTAQGYQVMIF